MRRKLFCLVVMLVLLMSFCLSASAASGTIRVDIGGKGEVTLYKVGEAEKDGHRLFDHCGGGFVTFDDVLSHDLAAWLAQRAKDGISRETEQGIAVFEGLEEGLYLVVQTEERDGYYAFNPFLISLPWDGYLWEVDASPKMEQRPGEAPRTADDGGIVLGSGGMVLSLLGLAFCQEKGWKRKKENA